MTTLKLPSYAKVNLSLQVKGKRGDGYHEIESLIQQIDLKDEIELRLLEEERIAFSCDRADIPTDETNLCVRAAKLLAAFSSTRLGVAIKLTKRIPHGAGLGGGSSNAAVTLLGLNRLWRLNLEPDTLLKLGAQLGSDVPFFVVGGLARVRGRGERVEPLPGQLTRPILLVFPRIHIDTKWAYEQLNLSLTKSEKNITFSSFNSNNFNDVDFYKHARNDFESVVLTKFPVLAQIKEAMYANRAIYAGMSGSGSSMFGIFEDANAPSRAQRLFEKQYDAYVCHPVKWGYSDLE